MVVAASCNLVKNPLKQFAQTGGKGNRAQILQGERFAWLENENDCHFLLCLGEGTRFPHRTEVGGKLSGV